MLEVVEGDTPRRSAVKDQRALVRREILEFLEANPYVFTKTGARMEAGGKPAIFNEVWAELEGAGAFVCQVMKKDGDRQAQRYWAAAPAEELA